MTAQICDRICALRFIGLTSWLGLQELVDFRVREQSTLRIEDFHFENFVLAAVDEFLGQIKMLAEDFSRLRLWLELYG